MRTPVLPAVLVLAALLFAAPVLASETDGRIESGASFAWGENMGWINFAPSVSGSYYGLSVTDAAVTGFAWSSNSGWINFNPTASGQGVSNTPSGQLSGRAWSSVFGWVQMDGVTIGPSGAF